jgi:hypothetical protein
LSFATKPNANAFGNLFFASEAPRKGVLPLSSDNVFAAEVSARCNASKLWPDELLIGTTPGLQYESRPVLKLA